jgi:hypothetical protein
MIQIILQRLILNHTKSSFGLERGPSVQCKARSSSVHKSNELRSYALCASETMHSFYSLNSTTNFIPFLYFGLIIL